MTKSDPWLIAKLEELLALPMENEVVEFKQAKESFDNRPSMYSSFSGVRKVVARKGRHLIKVKGLLRYNMVYADNEDFDAVYEYIRSHCPRLQQ